MKKICICFMMIVFAIGVLVGTVVINAGNMCAWAAGGEIGDCLRVLAMTGKTATDKAAGGEKATGDGAETAKLFKTPVMAIIIDDFGGFDRSGVDEMLAIKAPLTCAVIPFVDYSKQDAARAKQRGHEVIVHMPMESHVRLPREWYGATFIGNGDSCETASAKLDAAFEELPMAEGANIHIGSGVCRNKELMTGVIGHLKSAGKFFCDSRTHIETKCQEACAECGVAYLGRDVFLEPHGQGGYANACRFLREGAQIALDKGYAIAIGHVGREGGVPTAKAIADTIGEIEKMGIKIVPLSQIYETLSGTHN